MVAGVVTCLGEMRDRGLVAEDGIHPAVLVLAVAVAEAVCGLRRVCWVCGGEGRLLSQVPKA